MTQAITKIAKHLVNLIYPLHCAACGAALDPLDKFGVCHSCIKAIRPYPKPYSEKYSACVYEGALKELIHLFKYKDKITLSGILSKLMIDFINEDGSILDGIGVITFVPLHNRRLRQREYNQSKVLACGISKQFAIPLLDALEKTVSTKHQSDLSREERLSNLHGAFRVRSGASVRDLNIMLIDDVMTTGATLSECSKVFLEAGAKSVRCLTLARPL